MTAEHQGSPAEVPARSSCTPAVAAGAAALRSHVTAVSTNQGPARPGVTNGSPWIEAGEEDRCIFKPSFID